MKYKMSISVARQKKNNAFIFTLLKVPFPQKAFDDIITNLAEDINYGNVFFFCNFCTKSVLTKYATRQIENSHNKLISDAA